MRRLEIFADKENIVSDQEYLEQIYPKVKLGELVKFHGKYYRRITPSKNKFYQQPYHFTEGRDIYTGDFLVIDDDGEEVNTLCQYSVKLKEE